MKNSLFFSLMLIGFSGVASAQMTISAMGDILIHDALYVEASKSSEGFYSLFKTVKPLLDAADFSYGNLEGCVAPGTMAGGVTTKDPGWVYDKRVYLGTNFSFNYHPSIIPDLKKFGVDLVSTANNHALDRGAIGVDRTIESLRAGGLLYNGTRHVDESYDFTWVNVKGYRVGFLACTEMVNGHKDPYSQVLRCYQDQAIIESLVQQNKGQIMIITPHWGDEDTGTPNKGQKTFANRMAEIGVTAIIGNHPHVLQPLEWITTTDNRRVLVAYSLGNFLAWQKGTAKKASVILYLEFDARGTLVSHYWRPTWRGGNWVKPYTSAFGSEPLDYIKKMLGPSPK